MVKTESIPSKIRNKTRVPTLPLLFSFGSTSYGNQSVSQFSSSVMSDSLWPREPQHARPPCPSPTPGVHPIPSALRWWCCPTISSSVVPFSSCPQSFPASGSFQMSQLFTSGGENIGVSASTSVLPLSLNTPTLFTALHLPALVPLGQGH